MALSSAKRWMYGAAAAALLPLLGAALPASANAAVTFGANLDDAATGSLGCTGGCTVTNTALAAGDEAPGGLLAPSDGIIVRWRIKTGTDVSAAAPRVTRPGNSPTRTGAGTGPAVVPPANSTSTFDVRMPVQAGDGFAIDCCSGPGLGAFGSSPGADFRMWDALLLDGEAPRASSSSGAIYSYLLVNADIEPDGDGDGFGDETQDGCPREALRQDDCVPPETKIAKAPPKKLKRKKTKIAFTSEAGASFACKLDKRRFRPCASPHRLKRLKRGRHSFAVRATDIAGNTDPTAARTKFRVRR